MFDMILTVNSVCSCVCNQYMVFSVMYRKFKYSLDELQASGLFVLKKVMILVWLFIVLKVSCRNSSRELNGSSEMLRALEVSALSTYKVDPRCIHCETSSNFYCSCCCCVCRKTWTSLVVML